MTVRESVQILREQWLVVAVAVLAAVLVAGVSWLVRPAEYTSRLTLYVSTQSDNPAAAYQGAQLSQQRVVSYVELAGSPRVGAEVAARLGTDATPEQVSDRITASSPMDSVLVELAVTGTSPQDAAHVADVVGAVVADMVEEVERPTAVAGGAPVSAQVVQPATVPTSPSSTGLAVALLVGLFAGLAIGIVAVLLRRAMDPSIGTGQRLREVLGVPTLATVELDAGTVPLPVALHGRSPRAAGFHRLRATLAFLDPTDPPRVLLVAGAVPGEGRTSTVIGLAAAQAAAGSRVLVVDADLRDPALARVLGVDDAIGLTDVLTGRVEPEQASRPVPAGFDVLPSGALPADPTELLSPLALRTLFAHLRMHYDTVLVDSPALLPVTDAMALAAAADGVLVVCRRGRTSHAQVAESVDILAATSSRVLGGVLVDLPARRTPVGRAAWLTGRPTAGAPGLAPPAARPAADAGPLPAPIAAPWPRRGGGH
ncbi:polysaccharide biosynthesis tyrosine autokinase [Pseudonocardia sp.]|uniref:polysaccharide biosynthesis tyrosine autokinase n=1 Tax=Pseudonocardia sp. TaxID=60912 RepID=UPI002608C490|nr:polysaccharide biosynthesis tyrosine autokinase [Pseudonocardia sp.]